MLKSKKISNNKIWLIMLIIVSILLVIPSIRYLLINKTVNEFDYYFTYDLGESASESAGKVNGYIFLGLILIYTFIYLIIIKEEKNIFNGKTKKVLLYIVLISLIFMLMLPALSSDIYYYIGDSWVLSKYHENPYYTSVSDLQLKGANDEILNNTGYWKDTTSVYGPLYNMIAAVLVTLSFGNITIGLFVFKIASFIVHIINCYLIYKITKKSKYALIYGLNPLILLELLSNVHNDIYLILFILLSIYYLIREKKVFFSIIFLALSITIKYTSVLLVPFFLIFIFQKNKLFKRLLYCIGTGLIIILIVVMLYLPFYKDTSIFTNMLVQNDKLSQSLMLALYQNINEEVYSSLDYLRLPVFAIIYITSLVCLLAKRKISLRETLRKYNMFLIVFIFVILTNFQRWYIVWLLPTYFWQSKYMKKFIISLTITGIIPLWNYFVAASAYWKRGIFYSVITIILSCIYILSIRLIDLIKKKISNKRKKSKILSKETSA